MPAKKNAYKHSKKVTQCAQTLGRRGGRSSAAKKRAKRRK